MNDDRETYCREVEAYLCRKNDGHLVRVVGPAFEQVCGWAARGVPIKVVFSGIDRYFERYYAKGPRRRPVRVEFCEADILDVFDAWRRAVGVASAAEEEPKAGGGRQRTSLAAHLERVIARLTALRAGEDRALDAVLNDTIRELDSVRAGAKGMRGALRQALLERLRLLDEQLLQAARAACDAATLQNLAAEADAELSMFRDRMSADAFSQSKRACVDRLIREQARLPTIAFD